MFVSLADELSIIIKQLICLSSSNISQSWLIKDSLSFHMHRKKEDENNQYHICCYVILTISLFILAWNTLYVDGVSSNLLFQTFKAKLRASGFISLGCTCKCIWKWSFFLFQISNNEDRKREERVFWLTT